MDRRVREFEIIGVILNTDILGYFQRMRKLGIVVVADDKTLHDLALIAKVSLDPPHVSLNLSNYSIRGATAAWHEMAAFGFWLKSPDQFLVAIAATLMARYRIDELKSGDVSLLIGLLGQIWLFAERARRTESANQKHITSRPTPENPASPCLR